MLALHKSGKKGVNTIHSLDQSIVCEERSEYGLQSKSFPMSGCDQIGDNSSLNIYFKKLGFSGFSHPVEPEIKIILHENTSPI